MPTDSVNSEKLSEQLHEMLIEELDFKDSEINGYLDSLALNLILTTLLFDRRVEFYQFLANNDFDSAKKLVLKDIPDFHSRLLLRVREKFQEILP